MHDQHHVHRGDSSSGRVKATSVEVDDTVASRVSLVVCKEISEIIERSMQEKKRRIGIVGYGAAGKFLAESILGRDDVRAMLDLAFVWNRTEARLRANEALVPQQYWLVGSDLGRTIATWLEGGGRVDLIVEISHPSIVKQYGKQLLGHADLLVGSPAAFARAETERTMLDLAETNPDGHGCYIPSGAAWGVADIVRMNRLDTITALSVSMTFHPESFRDLGGPLRSRLSAYLETDSDEREILLYEGPVRALCELAPNNVNTMACLSLAASRLGFDGVVGRLATGKRLAAHVVEINVTGRAGFNVFSRRYNPSRPGAVTGSATFSSFLSSLLQAGGRGNGIHFC